MDFAKDLINGSPYVGVFGVVTDQIGLFPRTITDRQKARYASLFGVDIVQCSLAGSTLLGVLASGKDNRIIISDLVESQELDFLHAHGIKTRVVKYGSALGNWTASNPNACVHGGLFSEIQSKEIASFLGIPVVETLVNGKELVGASCKVNGNGFVVSPQITAEELQILEKAFQVPGIRTTANYGDRFVGNCLLVNSNGALVGQNTTTHEMIRIDEAFRK